jgi:hypothetical protein
LGYEFARQLKAHDIFNDEKQEILAALAREQIELLKNQTG